MKRLFVLFALSTLLLTTCVACSKDNPDTPDTTPSVSDDEENTITLEELNSFKNDPDYIALGGFFSRDDTNLSFFISGSRLYVNGIMFPDDTKTPLVLTGPLTFTEGTDFVYEQGDDKITFTFAPEHVDIKVDKGTTYTPFAGKFDRDSREVAETGSIVPKNGSALEYVGRIALTHYMVSAEGTPSYSFNAATASFDNATMVKFISLYADIFLTNSAEPMPEVSDKYLCYKFTSEDLNNLLLAATAGKFGVANLSVDGSDIVLKDGAYCVPCPGTYAGGVASSFTDEDPETINENLVLEAGVVKMDGTRYDLEMTITSSANEALTITGVQLDAITYKTVE